MVYMVKIPRPPFVIKGSHPRKFSFLNPVEHSLALKWLDEQNIVYSSSHYQITNSEEMIEMLSDSVHEGTVGDVIRKEEAA